MKINKRLRNKLLEQMNAVLKKHNACIDSILASYSDNPKIMNPEEATLWLIYYCTPMCREQEFREYSDSHINTALKSIGAELLNKKGVS